MISLNDFILLQNRLQILSSIPAEAHMCIPLALEKLEGVCEAVAEAEAEAASAAAAVLTLATSGGHDATDPAQVVLPDMSSLIIS